MTVRELISEINQRINLHYLDKEIKVVDHKGNEIGIVKAAMSTSHWPYFVLYTKEDQKDDIESIANNRNLGR